MKYAKYLGIILLSFPRPVRIRVDGFDGYDQLYDWEIEVAPRYTIDESVLVAFVNTLKEACGMCVPKTVGVLHSNQV